jgi:hypothetical protein
MPKVAASPPTGLGKTTPDVEAKPNIRRTEKTLPRKYSVQRANGADSWDDARLEMLTRLKDVQADMRMFYNMQLLVNWVTGIAVIILIIVQAI